MAKVTGLKQQGRDRNRVNLYLDGEFRLGLTKTIAAGLRIGQELSEGELTKLIHQEAFEVALRRGYQFLSRRPHTKEEIRRKLRQRQTQEGVIDSVIERLEHSQVLDDLSFATDWVENRNTFRPRGRKMLRFELRKKGVEGDLIEQALHDFDEEKAALLAAEKAYPRYRSLPQEIAEKRLLAYLARRGFAYGLCRQVVRKTLHDAFVSVAESEVET